MATINPDVSAITGYVEEHRLPLISRTVIGGNTIKYFNLMTGVKGTTMLNLLETDPALMCGNACGWNESGSTSMSQAVMCVMPLKVNMAFCDKKLLDTWANYEVKVAAGQKTLPFEEDWTNNIVKGLQRKIEYLIWHGSTFESSLTDDCKCTGILNDILVSRHEIAENTDPYARFMQTFNYLPSDVKAADDLIAFVGYDFYYRLIQSILVTSHFHIDDDSLNEGFVFPGTTVRVVPTVALNDFTNNGMWKDNIVIGRQSNFFYGTDLRGDAETFDLWYSKDNREFRLAIEFTLGSAVAFPDEVSWGATKSEP